MTKQYGLPCPVARTLDIIGDRWILLIVRDLMSMGPRKYVDLFRSLKGIAPNVLSDRLKNLEANGIIERGFYEDHPPRARYRLTRRGADLRLVMLAMLQWGNRHLYDGVTAVHAECDHELTVEATCERCGTRVGGRATRMKYRRREAARAVGASI